MAPYYELQGGSKPKPARHINITPVKKSTIQPIQLALKDKQKGGYKATERNMMYLRKYKRGESIGFTMKASLKAKGLLPRESRKNKGRKLVSEKYLG